MRESTQTKIRIGIVVALVFTLLFVSYSWLTKNRISKEKHFYRIKFKELGWVNKGDPVLVKGVKKGFVKDIHFYPDSIIVDIVLEDIRLRQGARARLVSTGIVGQMRINVAMGEGDTLPDWSTIEGTKERSLGEIIADFGRIMDSVVLITHETRVLLNQAVVSIETVSISVNATLETLRMLSASEKQQLDSTQRTIIVSLERLQALTDTLMSRQGTVGKLILTDSLYRRADSSLIKLNELLENVRRNPKRYINLDIHVF